MREMKDSGIEWIKEVPKEWDVSPLYVYFAERKNKNKEEKEDNLLSLSYGKVVPKPINVLDGLLPKNFSTYNIVETGDIIIRPTDLQNDKKSLRTGLVQEHGIITSAYIALRLTKDGCANYYHYLLHAFDEAKVFYNMGNGVRQGLTYSIFSKLPLLHPPVFEQHRIANYLDYKCSQIDFIIEKTKREIEKLKEYRQSVITEAVTKGLDSDVKMKDSGSEWIGEVPSHWNVAKTRYMLSMPITDGPHTTPVLYDEGVPFVSAEAVSFGNGKIDFSHIRGFISQEFYQECCKKYVPQLDDIYMIKSGATTGKIAIVDTTKIFTIWSPLAVFRPNKHLSDPSFMFYSLQSDYYQKQVELNWNYGTQQNIGMRVLESLRLCCPPLSEQQSIAKYLDSQCSQIETTISTKYKIIDKLQQYKKSLIYECVTGKKEVPANA